MAKIVALNSQAKVDRNNINYRIQKQISRIISRVEKMTDEDLSLKEHIAAMMNCTRMQYVFVGIRKEKVDEPNRGSAVRKYAGEFTKKANAARSRAAAARDAEPEPEPFSLDDILDDESDDIA